MKLLIYYCKDHKHWFYLLLVLFLMLLCLFYVYQMNVEPLLYGYLLILFFFFVFIGSDFYKYILGHQQRSSIREENIVSALSIEDMTLAGQDYHEILEKMDHARVEAIMENENQINETMDYFTMWIHQVKLPIAGMQLLLEEEQLDRKSIQSQLTRINQYTDMVLAYLRMYSKQSDFLFRDVDLDDLIRQSIRYFSTDFIARKIHLDFQPTNQSVLTDEKWLEFVIEQILSNAIKYTAGGTISVYLKEEPEQETKELVIEDNGMGISASDLARVFEKGYTGFNGRKDKKATGLGLYLCKEICRKLEHTISIESKPNAYTRVLLGLDRRRFRHE